MVRCGPSSSRIACVSLSIRTPLQDDTPGRIWSKSRSVGYRLCSTKRLCHGAASNEVRIELGSPSHLVCASWWQLFPLFAHHFCRKMLPLPLILFWLNYRFRRLFSTLSCSRRRALCTSARELINPFFTSKRYKCSRIGRDSRLRRDTSRSGCNLSAAEKAPRLLGSTV